MVEQYNTNAISLPHSAESIGAILITPDAFRFHVVEQIIDITRLSLQRNTSASIRLVGSKEFPYLSSRQVEAIYPTLPEHYLNAFKRALGFNPSRLVLFENTNHWSEPVDLFWHINTIKGKVIPHKREDTPLEFGRSIRGAIPLSGDRERYEYIDRRIDEGNLTDDDYFLMTNHLLHSPDDLPELAGLLQLLTFEDMIRQFEISKATYLFNWANTIS